MLADQHRDWELVVERDCRLPALVSLIKSAYLGLFRMLGYRYALSASGLAVGRAILGRFYEENAGKAAHQAQEAAREFFRPYRHMVRPIVSMGEVGEPPRGTVEDGRAGACFGSSGRRFALMVWVRVGEALHAVLLPEIKHPDSAEAYWAFLNDGRETLMINEARFDSEGEQWLVSDRAITARWPKSDESFDI